MKKRKMRKRKKRKRMRMNSVAKSTEDKSFHYFDNIDFEYYDVFLDN